jgi:very-short-patch-repair endonuclease
MREWDYAENEGLDPSKLTIGSNKRASWICYLCDNRWKTSIDKRAINKSGCRKCSSRKRLNFDVEKSIAATHPELAKDWCPNTNGRLTPEMFPRQARYEANWLCHSCGNQIKRSIKSYKGCMQCKKSKQLEINNLQLSHLEICREWHPEKNEGKRPEDFTRASNKFAWWICSVCSHDWQAKIANRTVLGRGCPLCSGNVVVRGKNDLVSTHFDLTKQWHPTKNESLKPYDFSFGSGKKVWWLCEYNHEFYAAINKRTEGTNCPACNDGRQTSFAEQASYFYIKQLYPDALNRYTADFLGRMELDIYIPSIKLAIEYDGEAWHKADKLEREERKYKLCKKHGIKLIRLREQMPSGITNIADQMLSMEKLYQPKNLEKMLNDLLKRINFSATWMMHNPVDIDISRDRSRILEYKTDLKKRSLQYLYPQIAKEWHPSKNGKQSPEHFKPGADFKAWWNCTRCGNIYQAAIGKRTGGLKGLNQTGCPKCGIEKTISSTRKAVKMIDPCSGEILDTFISISDAARKTNINGPNINMVCKGERPRAGGYNWSYVD